jgi:hypothetical protein
MPRDDDKSEMFRLLHKAAQRIERPYDVSIKASGKRNGKYCA